MRLDANDRSRLVFACLLTGVALPAVWWANEDGGDTGRPNVAAAGVPAADGAQPAATPADTITVVDPAYLTPIDAIVEPTPAATPSVQVGGADHIHLADAVGTYRRRVTPGRCEVGGLGAEGTITVFNPANGQSIECRALRGDADTPTVVLSLSDFDVLADFTDAPVAVEIRD